MSRSYRIKVSETVRKHIRVGDAVHTKLQLLNVLPAARMAQLLAAELAKEGFEEQDDGSWLRVEEDGTRVVIDTETATVRVSAEAEVDFEKDLTLEGRVEEEVMERGKQRLAKQAKKQLEAEADKVQEALQGELTDRLSKRLRDLHAELDKVSNRTMVAALKERAGQMGEIKEVSEDPESGALTIRVKV